MTPGEFESRYGVDAKTLRAYLRTRWSHDRNSPWVLTPEMVSDACRRFRVLEGSPTAQTSISPTARPLARSQRSKRSEGQAAKRSTGLHQPFLEMARDAGIPIAEGRPVDWLSGRGHLNECLSGRASLEVIGILGQIHEGLGGDGAALARKAEGSRLIPDLIHEEFGCIIEIDEVQHFTTARLRTFEWYPAEADLGFDLAEYQRLSARWASKGDRAFRHKVSADFPTPGGRQAQRAYNDALRDLLAPVFTGLPVIRIPVPDRSLSGAVDRLSSVLERLRSV